MVPENESYTCSPSTKWEWRRVKIGSAPAGDSPPKAVVRPRVPLPRRNRNKALWIEVRYVGGPGSSWLVNCRERYWRFEGAICLEDVMAWANGER